MPRNISVENATALAARRLVPRDFLWIIARDRTDGGPQATGFWSGVGDVTGEIIHPDTGLTVERTWYGTGTLISIGAIPIVSNVTVQTVPIVMSQIDDLVQQAVRLYDMKQARVEVYRGLLSPDTRRLVDPAFCRFVGFVDEVEFKTPPENEAGSVTLTCVSHTQELMRSNPDTRSDASQRLRSETDNFFQDAPTVGEWEFFWGRNNGKLSSSKAKSK
ncbi:hypothetical protein SAMN05892877_105356 [Rhizobium subbaraonis]|uniref:Uncharacterized protein n=1 Tax=Rhizobium subbaraonis TaxID=908946 RepID=A0A285UB62_9HYPH|nr:hypothetical protein [Rhizobium subbaraonis]SOC38973.1 hypothetical protein SAMN05892877_105356 [Rhizobium subbaraonis]